MTVAFARRRHLILRNNERQQFAIGSVGRYGGAELVRTRQDVLTAGQRLPVFRAALAADRIRDAGLLHEVALIRAIDEDASRKELAVFGLQARDASPLLHYRPEPMPVEHLDTSFAQPVVQDLLGHVRLEQPGDRLAIDLPGALENSRAMPPITCCWRSISVRPNPPAIMPPMWRPGSSSATERPAFAAAVVAAVPPAVPP